MFISFYSCNNTYDPSQVADQCQVAGQYNLSTLISNFFICSFMNYVPPVLKNMSRTLTMSTEFSQRNGTGV